MGVICFSSLKGGVGKTTLALNVAAAFAERGGETLLIDLDPTAHTTRFFTRIKSGEALSEAPLASLLLAPGVAQMSSMKKSASPVEEFQNGQVNVSQSLDEPGKLQLASDSKSLVDFSVKSKIHLLREVRKNLVLLPGGAELRHFLWGKGANLFKLLFARLIKELKPSFDYIVIDTPPDFSVLVRNALAISDLIVVPVDGSAMSIDCLNQLAVDAAHIKGPEWCIVRSMVSKQASKLRKISESKIKENLQVKEFVEDDDADDEDDAYCSNDVSPSTSNSRASEFLEFVDEASRGSQHEVQPDASPIYLLDSVVYRSEEQNKLSFAAKTAFESRQASKLALQYKCLARELDALLMLCEDRKNLMDDDSEKVFDFAKLSGSGSYSASR